jgi:hypothetical protein
VLADTHQSTTALEHNARRLLLAASGLLFTTALDPESDFTHNADAESFLAGVSGAAFGVPTE